MSRTSKQRWTTTLFVVLFASVASGQQLTIPEAVAKGSTGSIASKPSGPVPPLREIVRASDVIVTALVGGGQGHLSSDQLEVYTDYSLREVTVLYEKGSPKSLPEHPQTMTVTILGGTVMVNGVTFTHWEKALPPLETGTRVLLMLQRDDNGFAITRKYYGVFDISTGTFQPQLPREDFAQDYRGRPIDEVINAIPGMLGDR